MWDVTCLDTLVPAWQFKFKVGKWPGFQECFMVLEKSQTWLVVNDAEPKKYAKQVLWNQFHPPLYLLVCQNPTNFKVCVD